VSIGCISADKTSFEKCWISFWGQTVAPWRWRRLPWKKVAGMPLECLKYFARLPQERQIAMWLTSSIARIEFSDAL